MPLTYDNGEAYDVVAYSYDGDPIGSLIGETRVLIAGDLMGAAALWGSDILGVTSLPGGDGGVVVLASGDANARTVEGGDGSPPRTLGV